MKNAIATFPILRKRDGRLTRFDTKKITEAIFKALYATGIDSREKAEHLCEIVVSDLSRSHAGTVPQVEEIQDIVERVLIQEEYINTAKAYILYRAKRTSIREGKSELMDTMEDILHEKHQEIPFYFLSPSAKMLKVAAAASCNFYLSRIIPSQYADAHRKGEIHIHALEYYNKTIDSLQIPLHSLLSRGFSAGYGFVRSPRKYGTLAAHAAIILQSCQNDTYGEQSFLHFDTELGRFIGEKLSGSDEQCYQAMEGLTYNLNAMYSRVGAQVPLSTMGIGLDTSAAGRSVARNLLLSMKNGLGRGETPLFPRIVFYVKEGINYNESDPNRDLLILAMEVATARMNPLFAFLDSQCNSPGPENVAYWGDGTRIGMNRVGDSSPFGRGNIATVTINMPRIALRIAHKRTDFLLSSFYNELQRMLQLASQQLLNRLEMLGHLKQKELPFIMGEKIYMGSGTLAGEDPVKAVLRNGTLSLGFTGLAEALIVLKKSHHGADMSSRALGLEILECMKSKVDEIAVEQNLNFVLAAPGVEKIAGRFALIDRQEFGKIAGVTDKAYYTCGYHVPADYHMPLEDLLELDAAFQKYCDGGHFTFVTSPVRLDLGTMEKVIVAMKSSGIGFGGISFPLDECMDCGKPGIEGESCPGCNSRHIRRLRRAHTQICPMETLGKALDSERKDRLGNETLTAR